jgi:anti-anti-sigma regulatory factor
MNYEVQEEENKIKLKIYEHEIYENFNDHRYEQLFSELAQKEKNIEIDLSEVEVVDSLFIANLITLIKKIGKNKLAITTIHPHLKLLFERMNLDTYLQY